MKKLLFLGILVMNIASLFGQKTKITSNLASNKTSYGYEYKILANGTGTRTIDDGDVIFYKVYVYINDKLQNEPYNFKTHLESIDQPQRSCNSILDLVYLLKEGDSAFVIQKLDTVEYLPDGVKSTDIMKYIIKINRITDFATAQKEKEAEELVEEKKKEAAMVLTDDYNTKLEYFIDKYRESKLNNITKTASGLQYIILENGSGDVPKSGDELSVNYVGMDLYGSVFDESYNRGQAITFPVGIGRVIKGWDEILTTINKGSKIIVIIPPDLGYGQAGSPGKIEPDATLFFYMEILK